MSPWTKHHKFHQPQKLIFWQFSDTSNPLLSSAKDSTQLKYLHKYLSGLNCKTIISEPNYFDRDYLSEFSEFYSGSAKGYSNICQRVHFFDESISEIEFLAALSEVDKDKVKNAYLGFIVIRPIPQTPIGRTVIKWFNDQTKSNPRIKASRLYDVHLGGMELKVNGLAWQQQDGAVGACATIALWSAIHSSAFDENHHIPTTAEITKLAHKTASMGSRVFPSQGLSHTQLLEAIKELGLAPILELGDLPNNVYSAERFSLICMTYVRSGFPVILGGPLEGSGHHAICLTGFREPNRPMVTDKHAKTINYVVNTVYIHDDNLGPNVRFAVSVESEGQLFKGKEYVSIKAEAPQNNTYNGAEIPDPTIQYPKFTPQKVIVAIPGEIRLSVAWMTDRGNEVAEFVHGFYNEALSKDNKKPLDGGFHIGIRYVKISDYTGTLLKNTLASCSADILGKTRLDLLQNVPPMSLYLGVIRIWYNEEPLIDILHDTSDSDSNCSAFANVCFSKEVSQLLKLARATHPALNPIFGVEVEAF